MVMSGGGGDDPRESESETAVPLDWSFQTIQKRFCVKVAMQVRTFEGQS